MQVFEPQNSNRRLRVWRINGEYLKSSAPSEESAVDRRLNLFTKRGVGVSIKDRMLDRSRG